MWVKVLNPSPESTYSVAHGGLQGSVLFWLAADVVEGEQQMMVVCQIGRNLHLHLLIELGGSYEKELTFKRAEQTKRALGSEGALLVMIDDGSICLFHELRAT